jgi:Siphovirus ReqiPepy6 Gp37-like protein
VRTGPAEDVLKAYVEANMGPSAPGARRVAGLTVEASNGLGASVTGQARFQTLQDLLKGLADVAGLGFTIEQLNNGLQFQVYQPVDRSSNVRLDLYNGRLTKSDYAYSQPKVTRTIVGGDGDGTARVFLEHSNDTSLGAEAAWGRRIEVFADARSTTDPAKLAASGEEVLANDGKTQLSVTINPSDDQTMLFGVDWNLGDKVSVVVGDVELVSVVSEVGLVVAADGVRLGATVGEPTTLDYETQLITRQKAQALRISQLERSK